MVLGLPRNAPQELVYRETGWLPLNQERELRCAQYIVRAQVADNSTADEIQISFDDTHSDTNVALRQKRHTVAERNLSIANFSENIAIATGLAELRAVKTQTSPFPPWLLEKPDIILDYTNTVKRHNPLLLATQAQELLHHKLHNHLHVFTDGSKTDTGTVGCAFTIPTLKVNKQYRLNNDVSVYSAEMYAIYMALTHILDLPVVLSKVAILTDSKSSIQALENNGQNRQDLILACQLVMHQLIIRGTHVTLAWIPSHVGICGNEEADQAARTATALPTVTKDIGLTVSEVNSKLCHAIHTVQADKFKDIATEKRWFDTKWYPMGVNPDIPAHLIHLFYRLRTQSLKFHFMLQKCCCSETLNFEHIFQCQELVPKFSSVTVFGVPLSPESLLSKHPIYGWRVTSAFLRELSLSPVGAMI